MKVCEHEKGERRGWSGVKRRREMRVKREESVN